MAASAGGKDHRIIVWPLDNPRHYVVYGGKGGQVHHADWMKDGKGVAWATREPRSDHVKYERTFDLSRLELGRYQGGEILWGVRRESGDLSVKWAGHGAISLMHKGRPISALPSEGGRIGEVTFLPGDTLALANEAGKVYLYDLKLLGGGEPGPETAAAAKKMRAARAVLTGHSGRVGLSLSPDEKTLLSCDTNGLMIFWDLRTRARLLSLFVHGNDWVAWTPGGYYAASPAGERLVGWQVDGGPDRPGTFYPPSQFRRSLYRPDVIRLLLTSRSVAGALAESRPAGEKAARPLNVAEVLPPAVTLRLVKQEGARVQVVARAQGGTQPLSAVWLLLDGRPLGRKDYAVHFRSLRTDAAEQAWSVELPPGTHRLSAAARGPASQAVSPEVEVTVAAAKDRRPALYLLAVGIDAYPGDYRLECAVNDARGLQSALEGGGKALFRAIHPRLLADDKADLASVRRGLDWLRAEMTDRDVAVVFYAGHGFKDRRGQFYLMPHDADFADPAARGLSGRELKERLAAVRGRVVLLLDACHSGAFRAGPAARRVRGGSLTDNLARELADEDCGVVVMCAAMGSEESRESRQARHGYFTLALLEGMKGKADYNRDGFIHLTELDLYVDNRVTELSEDEQHPVTLRPGPVRSFPLVRLAGPAGK